MLKKLTESLSEKLSPIRELDLDQKSVEHLEKIVALNQNGGQVIFAPNHLKPKSAMREQFALADDFPGLNQVLKKFGIKNNIPVARGDTDMVIGESRVAATVYDSHRKIFSAMGRHLMGTIPININRNEPLQAAMKNIPALREVVSTLKG